MHSILIADDPPTDGLVYDLTTVEAVNAALDIDGNTDVDAETAEEITTNSKLIAELCDRVLALRAVTETFMLHEHWLHGLPLRQYPVKEIDSVTVGGIALASTEYKFEPESGLLWRWGTNLIQGCHGWRSGSVVVHYAGGYDLPDEAPASLAQACISMIAEGRSASSSSGAGVTIKDIAHGDRRVSYFQLATSSSNASLSAAVADLIRPFRRVVLA